MEWILKLVERFFPNRFKETKVQEAPVEWTLLLSRTYSGLAVATCSECFMPTNIRNEISKQQSRNKDALKLAQYILDKKVIVSPAILHAIRNETRQMIENHQAEKVVSAPESRTNLKTPTTGQKILGRDKFSETAPKAFAPP